MTTTETRRQEDFIRALVDQDIRTGRFGGQVVTRFPPEPNGYLHIGHTLNMQINFGMAADYGGRCHLRFDDTNPAAEEEEYVESIKEDVALDRLGLGRTPLLRFGLLRHAVRFRGTAHQEGSGLRRRPQRRADPASTAAP